MLTLIKREIWDHIVYFLGAAIFSAVFAFITIVVVRESLEDTRTAVYAMTLFLPVIITAALGFTAMGASQMYIDKLKKVSALLVTLPVSRAQILIARIVTGILAILTFLVPLFITVVVMLRVVSPSELRYQVYRGIVFEVSGVIFLMSAAFYCIGLQAGWTVNKFTPTLGALVLTCILVPLIVIKGCELQLAVILMLFIIASLVRTWSKFMRTSF